MPKTKKAPAKVEYFLGLKPTTEPREHRLGSAPMINTPGVLRWAINGYAFKKDRKQLLKVFTEGYSGPGAPSAEVFDRLLKGEIVYAVDSEKTVIFTA